MTRDAHPPHFPSRRLSRPLAAATAAVGLLGLLTAVPDETTNPAPVAVAETTATVFYYTKTKNWPAYKLHYAPDGGAWTAVPGVGMETARTDWVKKTVTLGAAAGLKATFNNGDGVSLMWTFRGIPTLYYGSEIEFQKGKRIDCGPTCPLATTGRAYYGDHLAGEVKASEFGKVDSASGAVAKTLAQPLVRHLQRLNEIRRTVPALQMGQYSTDGITGQMAFKRRYTDAGSGTDSFALVTVTGAATYTGIPNGAYRDAVTGDTRTVTDGTLSVAAPGKGNLRVYVLDLDGKNAAPGRIGTAGPYLK